MTLFDNKGATPKEQLSANDDSSLLHPQVDSATICLLKMAASEVPRVANAIWGMIQGYVWDESMVEIIEGMNDHVLDVIGHATNAVLSSAISPYFYSALKTLQSINDIEDNYSHEPCAKDNEVPPIASDVSDTSSCEQNIEIDEGGLMFQSAEYDRDENNERLDYIITQIDISRMARTASRHLDVDSISQLPTIIYHAKNPSICSSHGDEDVEDYAKNPSICSSHEDEDVEDFLLRNAHIIEDYFDNNEGNTDPDNQKEDPVIGLSQFSWMIVPEDPKEDGITRLSNSIQIEVPDSISICKSTTSLNMKCDKHDDESVEYCVICEEPFQDGESLHVLPCQHLFHCGCIDKWLSVDKKCITSGCPMCKNNIKESLIAIPKSLKASPTN